MLIVPRQDFKGLIAKFLKSFVNVPFKHLLTITDGEINIIFSDN